MAFSLHRKKTSPYWFAYVRYPDPKNPGRLIQTSKSTKERTKEGARKKAAEIEQAILSEAGAGEEKSRELYAILKEACDDATRGRWPAALPHRRIWLTAWVNKSGPVHET